MIILLLAISFVLAPCAEGTWSLRSDPQEKSTLQKVTEDKRHLAEDLQFKTKEEIEAMTPLELSYAFFSNHNYDKNDGLDGSEIFKALHHKHAHEDDRYRDGHISPEAKEREFQATVDLIDRLFKEFDKDDDGILSFIEFFSSFDSDIKLL